MKFIPGDIVRYKNQITKYRIELTPQGKFSMRHCGHGGTYPIPHSPDERLVRVGHDTTYRVPRENIQAFMKHTPERDASPDMREFVDRRMYSNGRMDTSGFDALKSAGGDDAVDVSRDKTSHNMNKEDKMSIQINNLVAKVTDNIKDAQLVTHYFGGELIENSIKDEYFVRDNYDDLLKEAKAREEKRLARMASIEGKACSTSYHATT